MKHVGLVVLVWASFGCGSSNGDQSDAEDGGTDGAADVANDGSTDTPGTDATPPKTTCTPPITAADVTSPTTVVTDCNETALAAAVTKGGVITFKCGDAPVTITLTKTLSPPTDQDTTIDGGGKVTLDGGGKVRILELMHPDYRKNDHVLTLQHLTFANGKATGTKMFAPAPAPCSQGFYDGEGGAVRVRDAKVHVIDCTFHDNRAAALGPDVGGGALYLMGCKEGIVVGSTFTNNSASNGGAIGSLNSELDVYNSSFSTNSALGNGANGDDASKCSVVADTGQHQVGSGGNGGAISVDGGSDLTHTFCGVRFTGNKGGTAAFGGAIFRTPDGPKQPTILDRCLFDSNTGDGGGALYFHNSTLTITGSTFMMNQGQGPGALQSDGTTVDFTNTTFYQNHSVKGLAAGFALFGGDGKITNCTFAKNTCDAPNMFGCAIFGSPNLTIKNTIFDSNTGTNPTEPMQCKVGTVTGSGDLQWPKKHVSGSSDDGPCVPGITFADPQLGGGIGDHGGPVPTVLPASTSPAVGTGTDCPAIDANGKPRDAAKCTAGAAEP